MVDAEGAVEGLGVLLLVLLADRLVEVHEVHEAVLKGTLRGFDGGIPIMQSRNKMHLIKHLAFL